MGNFFTSTQIYDNECLTKEKFIDKFCKKMAEDGYVTCESDESELSYILKFADNCKWVTITSEAYEQGNELSHKDTGRIAKMLGTTCVNTVVIDSDCAILELYDKSGKKADMFTIGRADDYFGDDIPQPLEKVWKPFLCDNSTWEQFNEIRNGDYVFVEEGLTDIAPIIGFDSDGILFSADSGKSDEYMVLLYFKKNSTKIKRLPTFASAFKNVCNEMLIPKGFSLLKSKYPYYVKVTDEGIVQTISFAKIKTLNTSTEGFTICIGLSLITLPLTNFELQPTALENQTWMIPMIDFLHRCSLYLNDYYNPSIKQVISYSKGDSVSMMNAIDETRTVVMPFLLKFFEDYSTLEGLYVLGEKMIPGFYEDVVILFQRIDEYLNIKESEFSDSLKNAMSILKNNPMMCKIAEREKLDMINRHESRKQRLLSCKASEAEYEIYMTQANETKTENLKEINKLIKR